MTDSFEIDSVARELAIRLAHTAETSPGDIVGRALAHYAETVRRPDEFPLDDALAAAFRVFALAFSQNGLLQEAISLAAATSTNRLVASELFRTLDPEFMSHSFAERLSESGLMDEAVLTLLRKGEQHGYLEKAVVAVAELYEIRARARREEMSARVASRLADVLERTAPITG